MLTSRALLRAVCVLCSTGVTITGSYAAMIGDPSDLFLAIREDRLFKAVGLTKAPNSDTHCERFGPLPTGVSHGVYGREGKPQVNSITLAAHVSVAEAKITFHNLRYRTLSVGPRENDSRAPDIGDERCIWEDEKYGWRAIALRRGNVTIFINGTGKLDDALDLARQMDKLIQNDRDVAPLGQFSEPPEILSLGFLSPTSQPMQMTETFQADQSYQAIPEYRGLGPREKVMFRVETGETLSKVEDGKFFVRTPPKLVPGPDGKLIEESGVVRVRVVAANADNVFVAREFDLNVVKQP